MVAWKLAKCKYFTLGCERLSFVVSASILENASTGGFNFKGIFYFSEKKTQGHNLGWGRLEMGNRI